MDALRGLSPAQPVRHYTLTAEGEKYIQDVSGSVTRSSSFCYGQKTVDAITPLDDRVAVRSRSHIYLPDRESRSVGAAT